MTSSIRNEEGVSPAERAFDLSGLVLAKRKITRALRATFIGTAAMGGAGLVYVVASALTNGPSTADALAFTLTVVVMVALFFGVSVLAIVGVGAGATSCMLDGNGLKLRYQNGRERVLRWLDPHIRIRLTLVSTSTGVSYDLTAGIPMLNPFSRFPMLNPISAELYKAILDEVQNQGLNVKSETTRARGVSVTTHRVNV